ncbi:MAG: methylenetetrahydrofolate reductase [NAD(P)H] [Deltaproteobacteria bacterium]
MLLSEFFINSENKKPVISFELFPPKTEAGMASLKKELPELIGLMPDFITVTYGAMGSTQVKTLDIASYIKENFNIETACHLTCVGSSESEITRTLVKIKSLGIRNIIALRGDPPAGETTFIPADGGYAYASDLVRAIRKFEGSLGDGAFGIAVAGYPEKHIEAASFDADIDNLRRKVAAGADVIITQLFFDNALYSDFVKRVRAAGITNPVVPGLMPILSAKQIQRIASLCGASIPADLQSELEAANDNDEAAGEIGVRRCISQALGLLEMGAPGIHFYVLNKSRQMSKIIQSIEKRL